jgi:hypothetical protein
VQQDPSVGAVACGMDPGLGHYNMRPDRRGQRVERVLGGGGVQGLGGIHKAPKMSTAVSFMGRCVLLYCCGQLLCRCVHNAMMCCAVAADLLKTLLARL